MKGSTSNPTGRCRLLELPDELQLIIYGLCVPQNQLYLLNFPCNSSYRGRYKEMDEDEKEWKSGAKQPPKPPEITQVCRFTRNETLPQYYSNNVFRARYCNIDPMGEKVVPLPEVIKWLNAIGPHSREMLKHFYLYDRNHEQDENFPKTLEELKETEIFTEMGGNMESICTPDFCAHLVTFGDGARRPGEVAIARRLGAKALRMEGEK